MAERESVNVLNECIEIQKKKSNDYQNPNSNIRQADYYPNGCISIFDAIHAKTLRMRSVMEAMTNDPKYTPNYESLEDSAKDLINYASFFVAYMRGKIDGQKPDRDWLNRKVPMKSTDYAPTQEQIESIRPLSTIISMNWMKDPNIIKRDSAPNPYKPRPPRDRD